jgi:putative ABC transport system substrate-binding protein
MTLAAGAAVWPLVARAQRATWRIGCLVTGSPESHGPFVAAFRQRLAEFGHVEGRDYILDLRWANGQGDRLQPLADELAQRAPDLFVAATTAGALAARRVMPDRPIVAATLIDPIGAGLVTSFARPGGNVTGMLISFETLLGKQVEVAREMIPGASRIGMLINPGNPVSPFQRDHAEASAPALGVRLVPVEARSPDELEVAFQTFAREPSDIVLVLLDAMFITPDLNS